MDRFSVAWCRRFLLPQFDAIGVAPDFRNPRHIEIVGGHIRVGDYFHCMATSDGRVRLVTWPETEGRIDIGNYVAISPGVRIKSATSVTIGDGCIIAENAYITDADWHGIYGRIYPPGDSSPVVLEDDVWISDRATILKGVRIGQRSIVAAGAVVTKDVEPFTVVAGMPARVVRKLDPDGPWVTRRDMFTGGGDHHALEEQLARKYLGSNTWRGFLRSLLRPGSQD